MQFPVPIKPTSNLMSPALQIAKDNPLYCALLLKILAFGKREIEEGKFKDAEDVFTKLK
jgi:hypothetical protein